MYDLSIVLKPQKCVSILLHPVPTPTVFSMEEFMQKFQNVKSVCGDRVDISVEI